MLIKINLRTIPEVARAYKSRSNRKDSFERWLNKIDPHFTFDGYTPEYVN